MSTEIPRPEHTTLNGRVIDLPTPERVTFTAREHFEVYRDGNGVVEKHLGKCLLVEDVDRVLAAREQALREEIALLADAIHGEADLASRFGQTRRLHDIGESLDRIARGETR